MHKSREALPFEVLSLDAAFFPNLVPEGLLRRCQQQLFHSLHLRAEISVRLPAFAHGRFLACSAHSRGILSAYCSGAAPNFGTSACTSSFNGCSSGGRGREASSDHDSGGRDALKGHLHNSTRCNGLRMAARSGHLRSFGCCGHRSKPRVSGRLSFWLGRLSGGSGLCGCRLRRWFRPQSSYARHLCSADVASRGSTGRSSPLGGDGCCPLESWQAISVRTVIVRIHWPEDLSDLLNSGVQRIAAPRLFLPAAMPPDGVVGPAGQRGAHGPTT